MRSSASPGRVTPHCFRRAAEVRQHLRAQGETRPVIITRIAGGFRVRYAWRQTRVGEWLGYRLVITTDPVANWLLLRHLLRNTNAAPAESG